MTVKECNKLTGDNVAKLLKSHLETLDNITNIEDWYTFKPILLGLLQRIYDKEEPRYHTILYLGYMKKPTINDINKYKTKCTEIINNIILELKTIGLPNSNNAQNNAPLIHNEVNQNVSQTNNINIIISTLENHFSKQTQEEIKEIIESNEAPEYKKSKIFETIKNTGENIIAKALSELMWKAFNGQ